MNLQKIKKFVTALAFSFFILFLFSFLSYLFNFNIETENNKLIIYLLPLFFLLLAFHFKEIIKSMKIKSSQRKTWKSKIAINIEEQKNRFSIFFEKNWVKWGLIPILLLVLGFGLAIAGILSSDEAFPVLVKRHSRQELNLFPGKKLLFGQRIQGEFKSMENNLGIVAVRFDTSQRNDNERINFRLKEKGEGDWYYENIYHSSLKPFN